MKSVEWPDDFHSHREMAVSMILEAEAKPGCLAQQM